MNRLLVLFALVMLAILTVEATPLARSASKIAAVLLRRRAAQGLTTTMNGNRIVSAATSATRQQEMQVETNQLAVHMREEATASRMRPFSVPASPVNEDRMDGTTAKWSSINEPINTQTLDMVFNNQVAFLREDNFLSIEECDLVVKAANEFGFDFYKGVEPPIGKIGITQFEAGDTDVEGYFKSTDDAGRFLRSLRDEHSIDLVGRIFEAVGSQAAVAAEANGDTYFAGLLRLMSGGARLHFDYAPFDAAEHWSISDIVEQVAVNIYLTKVEQGECVVYEHPWTQADMRFNEAEDKKSYPFNQEVVSGNKCAVLSPTKGAMTIFNSRNFHEVRAGTSADGSPRLTFSMFLGRHRDGRVVAWS